MAGSIFPRIGTTALAMEGINWQLNEDQRESRQNKTSPSEFEFHRCASGAIAGIAVTPVFYGYEMMKSSVQEFPRETSHFRSFSNYVRNNPGQWDRYANMQGRNMWLGLAIGTTAATAEFAYRAFTNKK